MIELPNTLGGPVAWKLASEAIVNNNEFDLEPQITQLREQQSTNLLLLLEHKVRWGESLTNHHRERLSQLLRIYISQ